MIALSSLTSHAETVTDVEQTELIQNDIQDLEQIKKVGIKDPQSFIKYHILSFQNF